MLGRVSGGGGGQGRREKEGEEKYQLVKGKRKYRVGWWIVEEEGKLEQRCCWKIIKLEVQEEIIQYKLFHLLDDNPVIAYSLLENYN